MRAWRSAATGRSDAASGCGGGGKGILSHVTGYRASDSRRRAAVTRRRPTAAGKERAAAAGGRGAARGAAVARGAAHRRRARGAAPARPDSLPAPRPLLLAVLRPLRARASLCAWVPRRRLQRVAGLCGDECAPAVPQVLLCTAGRVRVSRTAAARPHTGLRSAAAPARGTDCRRRRCRRHCRCGVAWWEVGWGGVGWGRWRGARTASRVRPRGPRCVLPGPGGPPVEGRACGGDRTWKREERESKRGGEGGGRGGVCLCVRARPLACSLAVALADTAAPRRLA